MALLASYSDPADAALALNALQRGQIPVESRRGEDQGLEFIEMHVADEWFDRACDVIDKHEAELMEARQQEAHQKTYGMQKIYLHKKYLFRLTVE